MTLLVILAFIVVTFGLIWFLLTHDHGRKLPQGSLWAAFGFGVLALVVAGLIEYFVIPANLIFASGGYLTIQIFYYCIVIGLIEETCKFVPLALFIYKKQYFVEHTDGIIFFAISGLTFGLGENIMYTIQYGAQVGIDRLLLTPFFHASTASILGYFLANMKINKNKKPIFIFMLLIIPIMHGLYDFGFISFSLSENLLLIMMSLIITLGLAVSMFILFNLANKLDRALMYAKSKLPTPMQLYCNYCGKPNPVTSSTCAYCGKPILAKMVQQH